MLSQAKIELITYHILLTLMCYFGYVAGGFKRSDGIYIFISACIASILVLPFEWINTNRKVSRLLKNVYDEKYDRLQVKKDLLFFPLYIGIRYLIEWPIGIGVILLQLFFFTDLNLLKIIPFLLMLPILASVNCNVGLLITENSLSDLLSIDSIRDAYLLEGSYIKIDLNLRIALLLLSTILIPSVMFGYLLYLQNIEQIEMHNVWLHVIFILILSAITVFISLNLLMKNIRKSNRMLMAACRAVIEGNLSVSVSMITTNEFGILSQSANALIARLRDLITSLEERFYELRESKIEQEKKNHDLEDAIAQVKTLSGLLPICAYCKKIRNDKGYWEQIEEYIGTHTEAVFSHGLCPGCAKELYPNIYPTEK